MVVDHGGFAVGPQPFACGCCSGACVHADWGLLSGCIAPQCMQGAARVCLLCRSGSHFKHMGVLGHVVLAVGLVFTLARIGQG